VRITFCFSTLCRSRRSDSGIVSHAHGIGDGVGVERIDDQRLGEVLGREEALEQYTLRFGDRQQAAAP
jgi:hypothetical protein